MAFGKLQDGCAQGCGAKPGMGNPASRSRTWPAIRSMTASSCLIADLIASSIQAATWGICCSVSPRVVIDEVPTLSPEGSNGLRVSNGTVL
jgi:hypothetical protein